MAKWLFSLWRSPVRKNRGVRARRLDPPSTAEVRKTHKKFSPPILRKWTSPSKWVWRDARGCVVCVILLAARGCHLRAHILMCCGGRPRSNASKTRFYREQKHKHIHPDAPTWRPTPIFSPHAYICVGSRWRSIRAPPCCPAPAVRGGWPPLLMDAVSTSKQKIGGIFCGMGRQNVRMILVHACG